MPDFFALAVHAITGGGALAWPLVVIAGALSSSGPCAATRTLALSSLVIRARRPLWVAVAFALGTLATYALLGVAAELLLDLLIRISHVIYWTIAVVGVCGGIFTIAGAHFHFDRALGGSAPQQDALGGAFLSGALFALVISPCCTPLLAVILTYGSASGGGIVRGVGLMLGFGLGHLLPLLVAVVLGRPIIRRVASSRLLQAANVVAGALMISLGGYYAILA